MFLPFRLADAINASSALRCDPQGGTVARISIPIRLLGRRYLYRSSVDERRSLLNGVVPGECRSCSTPTACTARPTLAERTISYLQIGSLPVSKPVKTLDRLRSGDRGVDRNRSAARSFILTVARWSAAFSLSAAEMGEKDLKHALEARIAPHWPHARPTASFCRGFVSCG